MTGQPYSFGRFTLDPVARSLSADGAPVPLGTTDLRLLTALVERAGETIAKDELIRLVWGRAPVSDNALYVHINALRKALGDDWIVNKQGRGYRFVASALQAEPTTPPPRVEPRPGNLPSLWSGSGARGPTRLIGRREHLRIVSDLLMQGRLVTLTGPGGVGKTRLALQAAGEAHFTHGVWLVELATLNNADLVPSAIASALGAKIGSSATPLEALCRFLAKKSLLLVLDNCEHVIAAAARTSEALLSAAPDLRILATSREPLSCSGEQIMDVPPLAVPTEIEMPPDLMRGVAAVDLFIERAIQADANYSIGDKELATVARICRCVDGLPLAIEMVAAWAGPLGLETLDGKVAGSLKAWLCARSTAPSRHYTLRATLEWSHGLLTLAQRAVLHRLAVFAGNFSMQAAEAVASDSAIPKEQVFEHVANLIRKSMIAVVPGSWPQRFRLLETTRAFMLEELAASADGDATRQRHASYVLGVLEKGLSDFEATGDAVWLERYSPMLDDVRAAIDWAANQDGDDVVALAGASWPLWRELSLRPEGRQRLSAAATRLHPGTPPAIAARLHQGLAEMLFNTDAAGTREELERALVLYRELGDHVNVGGALSHLAYWSLSNNRPQEAQELIREALDLLQPAGGLRTLANAYSLQLCIECILGRFEAAHAAGENAVRLCEMAGNHRSALVVRANLVQLLLESGDIDGAILAGRSVTMRLRNTRHSEVRGFALGVLAVALMARDELDEAMSAAREAAPLLRDDGALYWLFDHFALYSGLVGRSKDAALLAGYADAVYRRVGRQREPMGCNAVERLVTLLRETLPAEEIHQLGELGARLSEDQALSLALGPQA